METEACTHCLGTGRVAKDPLRLWYMRDNHTFRELPLDVERAIEILRHEVCEECFSHGMLCSHQVRGLPDVHAHGAEKWHEFEFAARDWLQKALVQR